MMRHRFRLWPHNITRWKFMFVDNLFKIVIAALLSLMVIAALV